MKLFIKRFISMTIIYIVCHLQYIWDIKKMGYSEMKAFVSLFIVISAMILGFLWYPVDNKNVKN